MAPVGIERSLQVNSFRISALCGAVALAFTGFGQYSLDALTGLAALFGPAEAIIALAAGVLGAIGNLTLRRSDSGNRSAVAR